MTPRCPRCGAPMVARTNRATQQRFLGCPDWPRCSTARPAAPDLATLHATLRDVTRERDTLQAGYDQLMAEVCQLRRLTAPPPDMARLVQALTRLIARCHPDKWGGESAVATALTQELLALRARLQEGR